MVLGAIALVVAGLTGIAGLALRAFSAGSLHVGWPPVIAAPTIDPSVIDDHPGPAPGQAASPQQAARAAAPVTATAMPAGQPPAVGQAVGEASVPPGGGALLYAADWLQEPSGWPTTGGWSVADGLLHNDGSDFGDANWVGGLWNRHWVAAPFALPTTLRSYFVEVEIQVKRRPACGSFGLVLQERYQVGIHDCQPGTAPVLAMRSSLPQTLTNTLLDSGFDPVASWHVYRVEVRQGGLRALLDGVLLAETRAETGGATVPRIGSVGLWDDHTELAVRAFRVGALPSNS